MQIESHSIGESYLFDRYANLQILLVGDDVLTVVIPTHNRHETLMKAITAYQVQSSAKEISEIVVVDDGSTDLTEAVVRCSSELSPIAIRYFRQDNRGPAAARNRGIREARSPLILFTDDDIIPHRDLVSRHLELHKSFRDEQTAVLGNVTWATDTNPTPFMEWYGREALFSYAELDGNTEVDFRYFYTCNISLKKEFLRRNGLFDEEFKFAAWEDIELGFRLEEAGMRLLYSKDALAFHDQRVSFVDACRRYRKSLAAAEVFKQKRAGRQHHELVQDTAPFKRRLKGYLAPALSPIKALMDSRLPLPWSVYRTMFRIYR